MGVGVRRRFRHVPLYCNRLGIDEKLHGSRLGESGDSATEQGSETRADSTGCVQTGQSEPSKAADAVINAALKGAFHWRREDAAAALSKTAKN